MKKGAKAILIILALAAVALVAYLVYRSRHKDDDKDGGTTPASNGSGSGSTSGTTGFPLKRGSKGDKVKFIQKYINWVNFNSALTVDGIWGDKTETAALKTFGKNIITKDDYDRYQQLYDTQNNLGANGYKVNDYTNPTDSLYVKPLNY